MDHSHIGTAELLGHQHPQKSQLSHLGQFCTGEAMITVPNGGGGR